MRRSLSEGMRGHHNSLGLLRLVLAALVIFSHAFPLGGFGADPFPLAVRNQETLGGLAVAGFFAISGYLIAKSGAGSDVVQFLWRRVLRIFPAFWTVLFVGAFMVGPLIWTLDGRNLSAYFTFGPDGPFDYLLTNADLTIRSWGVHDVFVETTPYGQLDETSVLNGSLWTLAYEWSCYLFIAIFVLFGALKYARWVVALAALFLLGVMLANTFFLPGVVPHYIPPLADPYRVSFTYIFFVGATLGLYSKAIPLSNVLGIVCGATAVVTLLFGGWPILGFTAYAYFLLWAAATLPKQVQWVGARNDYSYGVYVYGFLVQQVTAYFGWHQWGYVPWVAATLVVTGACAWLSWHAVEKRAMSLKDLGPGRGVRWWYDRLQRWRAGARSTAAAPQEQRGGLDR